MIITFQRTFLKAAGSTWKELACYLVYTSLVCFLYLELQLHFLPISATPITIIATALTLLLTFRNNSAYDRWWEARKIWGGIVNDSRTFGARVLSLVGNPPEALLISGQEVSALRREMVYRHLAYINALRLQLRSQTNFDEVRAFLSDREWQAICTASNKATQINRLQAQRLAELRESGALNNYSHFALQDILQRFYDSQGGAERIKNTPFPTIYDFVTRLVFWVFAAVLPFSLLEGFGYKTIFFSWVVAFVFIEVLRIGMIMQDPFRNQPNDTPMSSICRAIEIDLRSMLGETDLPASLPPQDGILM
jgi:ion channel-forming bestrophin family protein